MIHFPRFMEGVPRRVARLAALVVLAGLLALDANAQFPSNFALTLDEATAAKELRGESGTRISGVLHREVARDQTARRRAVTALAISSEIALDEDVPLVRGPEGEFLVTVLLSDLDAGLPQLEAIGFQETTRIAQKNIVTGLIAGDDLLALDDIAEVRGVSAEFQPITRAGSVTSEADFLMEAERVRAANVAHDGRGIRIGVLSDSYDVLGGAAAGVASGDLPDNVIVLEQGPSGSTDEGRAMIELIHDLAPGAAIAFATATVGGEPGFANNIRRLADPLDGASQVIVDDVYYLSEAMFQDGLISQAIDEVVTDYGAVYLNAVGNSGRNAWETTAPYPTYVLQTGDGPKPGVYSLVHKNAATAANVPSFDPSPTATDYVVGFELQPGGSVRFQLFWDDPYFNPDDVEFDLDLVYFQGGDFFFPGGIDDPNRSFELATVTWGAEQEDPLVFGIGAAAFDSQGFLPDRVKLLWRGSGIQPILNQNNSPTASPRGSVPGALQVGAINYFNQEAAASFSSAGPVTVLFDPDGEALASPDVRSEPALAAIQGTNNTFFGSDQDGSGTPNFFGTSAAAPHAAAVAALILSADPILTPAEVAARMIAGSIPMPNVPDPDRVGAGNLNAWRAVHGPQTSAELQFVEDAHRGFLPMEWETYTLGSGTARVLSTPTPDNGNYHLLFDTAWPAGNSTLSASYSEATVRVTPTGIQDVILAFRNQTFDIFAKPPGYSSMPATFTGRVLSDGVAMSVDGDTWFRATAIDGAEATPAYSPFGAFNLSSIAAANGIVLASESDLYVRFQRFGYGKIADSNGGMGFDGIVITAPGDPSIVDSDADGVPDVVEQGAPNSGDGNDDGFADDEQPAVASLPTATGNGFVTVVASEGELRNVRTLVAPDGVTPDPVRFPFGFVSYEIANVTQGAEVTVDLLFEEALPSSVDRYLKYVSLAPGIEPWLVALPSSGDSSVIATGEFVDAATTRRHFRLMITDGAPGDATLLANGWIVDPGSPGSEVPLFVDLASFTATILPGDEGVLVEWTTAAEVDNVGFHVREALGSPGSSAPGARLTSAIVPAQGSPSAGASYDWTHSVPVAVGELRGYYLEDIDIDGVSSFHGPVFATEDPVETSVSDWTLFQ